jgi:hypothetical protein
MQITPCLRWPAIGTRSGLLIIALCSLLGALVFIPAVYAQRLTMSLDGEWEIEDGNTAAEIPATFAHVVAVPGLANLA